MGVVPILPVHRVPAASPEPVAVMRGWDTTPETGPAIMTGRSIMTDTVEDRIRERAHHIWEREGRPDGRAADHWALAREEIAIEDNVGRTLLPNPSKGPDDTAAGSEPLEPALSLASQADMPGLEDQGKAFRVPGSAEGARPKRRPGSARRSPERRST